LGSCDYAFSLGLGSSKRGRGCCSSGSFSLFLCSLYRSLNFCLFSSSCCINLFLLCRCRSDVNQVPKFGFSDICDRSSWSYHNRRRRRYLHHWFRWHRFQWRRCHGHGLCWTFISFRLNLGGKLPSGFPCSQGLLQLRELLFFRNVLYTFKVTFASAVFFEEIFGHLCFFDLVQLSLHLSQILCFLGLQFGLLRLDLLPLRLCFRHADILGAHSSRRAIAGSVRRRRPVAGSITRVRFLLGFAYIDGEGSFGCRRNRRWRRGLNIVRSLLLGFFVL